MSEKEARGREYVPVGPVRVARGVRQSGRLYDTVTGACYGDASEEMRAKIKPGVKFEHIVEGPKGEFSKRVVEIAK